MHVADATLAPNILATLWSTVALAAVFILLKILARVRRRARLWWDDYFMLLSWLCLGLGSACLTCATTRGLGRHVQFLDDNQRSFVPFFGTISAVLTMATSAWSKVSFALFLLRISSSGCTEWVRRVALGIVISFNVMLVLVTPIFFISCRPVGRVWRPDIDGRCWDDKVKVFWATLLLVSPTLMLGRWVVGHGNMTMITDQVGCKILCVTDEDIAYSGVADVILAFLPWKIIWCLPFKKRDKIGLVAVMSLGVFAAVASFIKCAHIGLLISEDFTFDGWRLIFWSVFEPTLTPVDASIPVVRTLFRDLIYSVSAKNVLSNPEDKGWQNGGSPWGGWADANEQAFVSEEKADECINGLGVLGGDVKGQIEAKL